MREVILAGLNVVSDGLFMDNAYIHMRNGKIVYVGKNDKTSFPAHIPVRTYDDDTTALPGFIDVHIHGGYGVDVMDATEDVFTTLGEKLPTEGTTAYLATTITSSKARTVQALQQCAQSVKKLGSAELLGVHLEGPFIHPDKRGAQPLQHIERADVEMFAEFQRAADGTIRIVTLAPEIEGANKLLQKCNDERVIASIGHTTVDYETLEQLVQDKPMHVTHLYNAMPGLHHRAPGVVGAAFTFPSLKSELIVDGMHSKAGAVRSAFQAIGSDRLFLITDSMRAKGMPDGDYDLGGQTVRVHGEKATLEDGTLAGSVLRMNDAVRLMRTFTDASWEDVAKMTSWNQAKALNISNRKGNVAAGFDADVVLFGQDVLQETWCAGQLRFEEGSK